MADDLSDAWSAIRQMQARLDRVEKTNPLESASVTGGQVRFVGGTLRVDEGGRVEIVGTLQVEGEADITGPVTISGDLDLTGTQTVQAGGSIIVAGTNPIVLQTVEDSAQISLSGSRIFGVAGGMAFATSDVNGPWIALTDDGHQFTGVPNGTLVTGDRLLAVSSDGFLKKVPPGSGGDGGPGTPVDPTDPTRTYRWPFARNPHGTYAGHSGIDWPRAAGTPIRAIGAGVVQAVYAFSGNTFPGNSSEPVWRGNCVVINHGTVGGVTVWSLYAHMLNAPAFTAGDAITSGQVIGQVGDTGYSDGNHLHMEIIFNGSRLGQGMGGYERAISWMDANASGSWG